jgi:hypothetical protein
LSHRIIDLPDHNRDALPTELKWLIISIINLLVIQIG